MLVAQMNLEPSWRGGENQVFLISKGLKERGTPPILIAHPEGLLWNRARDFVSSLVPLKRHGEWDLLAAWRLRKVLKKLKPEILHVHTAHDAALAALAVKGLPVHLIVMRAVDFPIHGNLLSRWKYRQAEKIIAVSRSVAKGLETQGLDGKKIATIYPCVDLDQIQKVRNGAGESEKKKFLRSIGAKENALIVGMFGALTPQKDPLLYVAAADLCRRENPDTHFILVGEGPLRETVQGKVEALNLKDRFTMLGFRPDPLELMSYVDCVVLSSANEGLPNTVLEAMALGIPVLATDVGGVSEAVRHNETGYLAPKGDASVLAAFLRRLIRDTTSRQEMGRKAKEAVRTFDVTPIVDQYLELYHGILRS